MPKLLRAMRTTARLTQRDLASRLAKPQPWVHKSEIGERRVDIAEFVTWATACGTDPLDACRRLIETLRLSSSGTPK